jgi:hypothetical protein
VIRFERGTSVPAIDAMGRPRVALRWLLVNEDPNSGWSQRCPIKIEISIEGSIRRQLGMETRGAQEIQRDKGLGHQAIPQMQWKILVEAAEARDEMIFESADGAFSSIASVFSEEQAGKRPFRRS